MIPTPSTPPAPPKLGSYLPTEPPIPFGIRSEKSHIFCEDSEDFEELYRERIRGFRRAEKVSRPRLKIKEEMLCV